MPSRPTEVFNCYHSGEFVVIVDASKDGHLYTFAGAASSAENAVDDAEQHAFAYLGDSASIGDWKPA